MTTINKNAVRDPRNILRPKEICDQENPSKNDLKHPEVAGFEDPVYTCHGWLDDLSLRIKDWRVKKGFETNWTNVPEKLMLVVTELGEAMEAYRHLNPDTISLLHHGKVPTDEAQADRTREFCLEIADAFIRLLDLSGSLGLQIENLIEDKMLFNCKRPFKHGKTC